LGFVSILGYLSRLSSAAAAAAAINVAKYVEDSGRFGVFCFLLLLLLLL
jgi:hypothetical protein